MTGRIAALIMAAGKASRFGSCKQLAGYGNSTVLQHIIDIANAQFQNQVFVVTGHYHHDIAGQIKGAQLIYNPDWGNGLGCSIAHGVTTLSEHYSRQGINDHDSKRGDNNYDGILILLADQPAINASHLETMQHRFNGKNIVCAHYQGANGVPALFPQSYYRYLRQLKGDKGAKRLLNSKVNKQVTAANNANIEIISVEIPEATTDIDTPADLIENTILLEE